LTDFFADVFLREFIRSTALATRRSPFRWHLCLCCRHTVWDWLVPPLKKSRGLENVEISEDVYIIKADEAEKHVKPPELTRILIILSQARIQPGKKQTFTAKGLDQFGRDFEADKVEWSATGGEIKGIFTKGEFLKMAEVVNREIGKMV